MAWASKKLYAILMSSEEGKDILEGIGEKSQDEFDKEVEAFFGEGGKSASQNADYKKAKKDGNAKENVGKKAIKFDRLDIIDSLDGLEEDASEQDFFNVLNSFGLTANQKEALVDAYNDNKLDDKTFDSIVNPDTKSVVKPDNAKQTKNYPKLNPKRPFGEKQKEIDGWIDEYLNDADVLGSDYYDSKNQPNRENLFKEISSNFPNDEIEHPQKKQYIYDKIDKAIENRDYILSKGYIQDFDELDDEIEDYIYDELLPQNVSEEEALNYVLTYLGEDGEEPYVRNYFKNKISKIYKE